MSEEHQVLPEPQEGEPEVAAEFEAAMESEEEEEEVEAELAAPMSESEEEEEVEVKAEVEDELEAAMVAELKPEIKAQMEKEVEVEIQPKVEPKEEPELEEDMEAELDAEMETAMESEPEEEIVVKSENAVDPDIVVKSEDDLEDGEIDDDTENEEIIADIVPKVEEPDRPSSVGETAAAAIVASIKQEPFEPVEIGEPEEEIMNETLPKKSKSKKHNIVEDDFAGSVESAIAAALKKDGIMPPMPKLESRDDMDKQSEKEVMLSKSSRRRKRRKLRDERERERDNKKVKKYRSLSPDTTHMAALGLLLDEDVDEDEMLCVRGGSPPPMGLLPPLPPLPPLDMNMAIKKEPYDTDDSYSSYESYDSGHMYVRYSTTRKKDSSGSRSKRKDRSSSRRDDERRAEKRSRRNYDDSGGEDKYMDRHPQQPRKLELCKFYLMECCAKKDKCSYMHSDFPCKYYYLGMDCVYRSACKFSHGKPLTDQLRSVLLKHLETAPKEILGTFRRISRENALNLMNTTHERICEEHGVENTLAPPTMTTNSVIQSQASGLRNGDLPLQQNHQNQQDQQQLLHPEIIPSLLDMVIAIPPVSNDTTTANNAGLINTAGGQSNNKSDKQRKSRWCDSPASNSPIPKHQSNLEPPSSNAPSYLDLKNLTGILSTDRIEKLSQFGVVNLEQINQLTLSQLNNIGLTIAEISEIQLNARNMARLGVVGVHGDSININNSSTITTTSLTISLSSNQDVDMRFLPSCLPLTTATITASTSASDKSLNDSRSISPDPRSISGITSIMPAIGSSLHDPICGSSSVGGIDYSQYLRDSNLGYDKNDLLDDEKDEEQLVIDDQGMDTQDENSTPAAEQEPELPTAEVKEESENESKSSTSLSYGGGDSNDSRLPPPIKLSDKLQNILKDPISLHTVNVSALINSGDIQSGKLHQPEKLLPPKISIKYEDDNFYGINIAKSRDTDTKDDYREPKRTDTRDEQRDPRITEIKVEEFRDPRLISRTLDSKVNLAYPYKTQNSDDESDRSRSQSPIIPLLVQQMEHFVPLYDRQSMYDWTPKCIQDDLEYSRRNKKADKDMRLSGFVGSSNSDIDLRLPFQPVKHIQIAKEIDGSMTTLMPILYRITEIDVSDPKYSDLRHSTQCDDSTDPRIRRIFGMPELSNSKALAGFGRPSRPTIASPSSVESSSSPTHEKEKSIATSVIRGPRADPRRAAVTATITSGASAAQSASIPVGNPQQNVEIRMLLQKSEWYKNLNSKYKIMVNQQLALVSTELKRFHQDPSPNKVFDIQFIMTNQNLQQILTNMGIYIDDNGQVAHIENDMGQGMNYGSGSGSNQMMNESNMTIQQRMALQQQMDFLRGPPPNMNIMGLGGNNNGQQQQQGMFGGGMNSQYGRNSRHGILGMSPGSGGGGGNYNPFSGGSGDNGGMDSNYCSTNNPFANNYGGNGGNFGRGNRNNNYSRQGGGSSGNRMGQNRRTYKPNNSRDRRGGGSNNGGGNGNQNTNGGGNMDET